MMMVPLLVIALVTVNIAPESIVSESLGLRIRLDARVQVLAPEFQVPPIASHTPLASPTCNS